MGLTTNFQLRRRGNLRTSRTSQPYFRRLLRDCVVNYLFCAVSHPTTLDHLAATISRLRRRQQFG